MNYRLVGVHAENTAEGAMLAPGDYTEDLPAFDPKDPHNKRMIDEGLLMRITDAPEPDAPEPESAPASMPAPKAKEGDAK